MRNKYVLALGGLVIVVTAGTMAYAEQASTHENDALADVAKVQVSVTQAITTAEQAASGKATKAELENEKNLQAVFCRARPLPSAQRAGAGEATIRDEG